MKIRITGTGVAEQAGLSVTGDELGEPLYDEGEVQNGLWDLEGEYGGAHAALCEEENWDYAEHVERFAGALSEGAALVEGDDDGVAS